MNRVRQVGSVLAVILMVAVIAYGNSRDITTPPGAPIDLPAPGEDPDALALPVPSGPDVWTGEVTAVPDGDTITVRVIDPPEDVPLEPGEEVKVRLLRIDAPERERDDQPRECWYQEATDALRELTPRGSVVTLQWDTERLDRFGRDLAHVWTETGIWANGWLLLEGHARVVTFRPNVAHDDRVRQLEQVAVSRDAGMWGAC